MQADQESIDRAVRAYNEVTRAHKRAPVERYIRKQLAAGETVELASGEARWTSALQFAGTADDMRVDFLINPALPERFQTHLEALKARFHSLLTQ